MSIAATEAVTGLLGTGSTGSTGSSTSTGTTTSTGSTGGDKDTFLQLLVAQLRYQDPMNPTDSSAFLSQSAQFTALEKMQDVADQTAQLLAAQVAFGASSLVGRTVSFPKPDGTTGTGRVDGVTFGTSGPVLDVGGTQVPVNAVLSVTSPETPAAGTTGSTAGSTD